MFAAVSAHPLPSDVEQEGLDAFCVNTFAACAQTQRFAAVRSKLSLILDAQMQFEYASPHEFSFEIEIESLDDSHEPFATQDRGIVRSYVGEACALTIMPVVVDQMRLLVKAVSPPVIYRVTKMRGPHPKALVKHNLLTGELEALGYQVRTCDYDVYARAYWIMERSSPIAS